VNHEILKKLLGKTMGSGVALLVLMLAGLAFVAQPARSAKPAAATLAEDKGTLVISVNGQAAGTENFSITHAGDHWVARGTTEIHAVHGAGHVTAGPLCLVHRRAESHFDHRI
jgi:hypothetical protein